MLRKNVIKSSSLISQNPSQVPARNADSEPDKMSKLLRTQEKQDRSVW